MGIIERGGDGGGKAMPHAFLGAFADDDLDVGFGGEQCSCCLIAGTNDCDDLINRRREIARRSDTDRETVGKNLFELAATEAFTGAGG